MSDIHISREHILSILGAAVAEADPTAAVRRALRVEGDVLVIGETERIELAEGGRVWLVGAGKAAPRMAEGVLERLGPRLAGGTLTTKEGHALPLPGVEVWEASHPLPNACGLAGAAEALRLARQARAGDLVLCLISGGASALWPAPPPGVSLGDLQRVTDALLRAGAPIGDLNTVRKHLSRIAGGQLARAAAPARVAALILSDVLGSPPDVIASGPTVPDPSTFAQALEVLARYHVAAPPAILRHLQAGAAGEIPETPRPGELRPEPSAHVVADVREALRGAAREAERLGYASTLVCDRLEGEAREVAALLAREALHARDTGDGRPRALLWGGETTVTVRGDGRGGRNQELALAAALVLEGQPRVVLASLGTDGTDGPTDAAGGVVDGGTVERGRALGLSAAAALERNDAYPYLEATGDLIVTGPTGTNVNDVVVALVAPRPR